MKILFNHQIKPEKIYEGLIHSASVNVTADMLRNWIDEDSFDVIEKEQTIELRFVKNLDLNGFKRLLQLINNLGWYISGKLTFKDFSWKKFDEHNFMSNDFDTSWIAFKLESKYDLEGNIHDYETLYHISQCSSNPKIEKIGLVPKSKNKILTHPPRIYLLDDDKYVGLLTTQLMKRNPQKYCLWIVDFKGLVRENPSIRLFSDPNFKLGFYTLSNIPPKFLTYDGEIGL